jgi:hypothetical protein
MARSSRRELPPEYNIPSSASSSSSAGNGHDNPLARNRFWQSRTVDGDDRMLAAIDRRL